VLRSLAALSVAAILTTTAPGQVKLREGGAGATATDTPREIIGSVLSASVAGLVVELPADSAATTKPTRLISWDRVKLVDGPAASTAAPYLELSDRLWRARTRVERGDWLAAASIFRELAPRVQVVPGGAGPTGAVVFEGLLRCDLARGARASALSSWFELLLTLDQSGAIKPSGLARPTSWIGGTIDGPPVLDPRTGLCPQLAPMWVGETSIDAAASVGEWDGLLQRSATPTIAVSCIRLFLAAARAEANQTYEIPSAGASENSSEGVRLVRLILLARAGNAEQREVGRAGLTTIARAEGVEPWVEAWCRAGIGRSFLKEPEAQQRIRGVLELMNLPARFNHITPDLAALALAESSSALWDLGDREGAAILKAELSTLHPGHSAALWSGLDKITLSAPTRAESNNDLPSAPPAALQGTKPAIPPAGTKNQGAINGGRSKQ